MKFLKPSLVGAAIGLIAVALVVLGLGSKKFDADLILISIATIALGAIMGLLVEWILDRVKKALGEVTYALGEIRSYSQEMHKKLRDSTLLLTSLLAKYKDIAKLDDHDPLQKWALTELWQYFDFYKITVDNPRRAREEYCRLLRRAIKAADVNSTWLGIHEDSVSFFTSPANAHEAGEYINELNEYKGKKYRIFVKGEHNNHELCDPVVIGRYLADAAANGLESFMMSRADFDAIVRPPVGMSIYDWALYGEHLVLEFNEERKIITFHVASDVTKGMRRLLSEVRLDEIHRTIGIENIDYSYVKQLQSKKDKK